MGNANQDIPGVPMSPQGQVAFASATLPAAGAYSTSGAAIQCRGYRRGAYACSYTRGAVGGKVQVRQFESFDGGTTFKQTTTLQIIGAVPPAEAVHQRVPHAEEYAASGAAAETYEIDFDLPAGATHVKIEAAESGQIATPGTFAATVRLAI